MGLLAFCDHPQDGLQQSQNREAQPSVPPLRGGGCELEPVEPPVGGLPPLLGVPPLAVVPPVGGDPPELLVPPPVLLLVLLPVVPPAPEPPHGGLSHLQMP
jgi:hypothetical protein